MWVTGRFDLLVEVVCDEEIELANFLNERIHGPPDIARVEVMTRIDMFKNQFLLKRHVPWCVRHPARVAMNASLQTTPGAGAVAAFEAPRLVAHGPPAAPSLRESAKFSGQNVDERTGKPHGAGRDSDRGDRCPQSITAALGDMTAEVDCPCRLGVELVAPGP